MFPTCVSFLMFNMWVSTYLKFITNVTYLCVLVPTLEFTLALLRSNFQNLEYLMSSVLTFPASN